MNDVKAAILTVCVVLALPGCGESARSPAALLTRSPEAGQDEMSAIVRGTLQIDIDRGCISLSGKPVVWPARTTLSTDSVELRLPDGLSARPGDLVEGGGGEIPAPWLAQTPMTINGDVAAALACAPGATDVVVFTARGERLRVSRPY